MMPYLLRKKFSWADLICIYVCVQIFYALGLWQAVLAMLALSLFVILLEDKFSDGK